MAKKRRTFSAQFKVDAVMDLLTGTKTSAEICRERNITDKLLYRWKNELLERLPSVFEGRVTETNDEAQRIAELERMVGRLALENEILKNAESWRETHRQRNGR
jgi:transposase-like protein